jgi:uncharacterized protein YggE
MKRCAPFIAIAATIVWAAPASAQAVPSAISVSGEATISVAPDQAQIEAGVTSEAKTARGASEANNAAMGQVLLALKAAGIEAKDIQTSRLSLQPESAPNRTGGANSIVGYRASNQVTVRLRDVAKVAGTIDMLVGAGATDIGGIDFSVSNASKLLDDARAQAIADARRKAEILAKAAGVTLGAPLSISEGDAPGPIAFRKFAAGMPAPPTPVAQGEETLQVNVSVSWEIKPGP